MSERATHLRQLAQRIANHFHAERANAVASKIERQERVGLLFATIKGEAPTMTGGERAALVYAFGVDCKAGGMADSSVVVRRSELSLLLDHSNLIPEGANAWRPTVTMIQRSRKSARQNLDADISAAERALVAAQARYDALVAEREGLDNAEEIGTVEKYQPTGL